MTELERFLPGLGETKWKKKTRKKKAEKNLATNAFSLIYLMKTISWYLEYVKMFG